MKLKAERLQAKNNLIGAGLRHAHFPTLLEKPQITTNWFEVISENFMDTRGYPFEVLQKIRKDYPIGLHGVSMSLASAEELDKNYLQKLKELIQVIDPVMVSDHLCWTGHHKNNLHNLLPFPYNDENLDFLVKKISYVQDYLQREIAVENLSAYFNVEGQTYTEWEFINLLAQKSGCKILLDINNVYVNSQNQKFDPYVFLDHIDPKHIGEIHLAGFSDMGTFLFDTHSKPVHPEVWKLFEHKVKELDNVPVLVEWDEDLPEFQVVDQEVVKAKEIWDKYHE